MEAHNENRKFASGAVRDGGKKPALHLISPHAMNRLGEWLRFACEDRKPKPYPKRNWEAGLPFSETVASIQRHIEKFKLGDTSEDHVAAILFGGMALAHFEEEIKAGRLPASLDDMPKYVQPKQSQGVALHLRATAGELLSDRENDILQDWLKKQNNAPGVTIGVDLGGSCGSRTVIHDEFMPMPPPIGPKPANLPPGRPTCPGCGCHLGELHRAGCTHPTGIGSKPSKPFTVYLCGPITGQQEDYSWRGAATGQLAQHGIKTLDPLRGKKADKISNQGLGYMGQLAAPEIASRDELDIQEADVILAHFPYDPPRQSIGSLMEMGAAAIGFKKPVILCTSVKVFNDHLFCRNFCTLEPNFDQAIQRVIALAQVKKEIR